MQVLSENDEMLSIERGKWSLGFKRIAGIDEAGRGPLAGPVVAAAAILPGHAGIPRVDDSKKLSEEQRGKLHVEMLGLSGFRYSVCEISSDEIDSLNILRATHKAMLQALSGLHGADFALVDGLPFKGMRIPVEFIVKGDAKSASIAAASIIAKVHRDRLMMEYARQYPQYGFEHHKGYGTKEHLDALMKHGPCPIHRKTFAPVRNILNPPSTFQGELEF